MSEELKPCPFCGSTDIDWNGFGGGDRPDINIDGHSCRSCGAAPGEYGRVAWNTRPIEDALRAEVAALEEENHNLRDEHAALHAEINIHHPAVCAEYEAEVAAFKAMHEGPLTGGEASSILSDIDWPITAVGLCVIDAACMKVRRERGKA